MLDKLSDLQALSSRTLIPD
jgi:syntaxin 1B/2/3